MVILVGMNVRTGSELSVSPEVTCYAGVMLSTTGAARCAATAWVLNGCAAEGQRLDDGAART
jgi:hypothetical protein